MEKIPTPVLVGGGLVLLFVLLAKMSSAQGATANLQSLGPVPNASADQAAAAREASRSSGFSALVNAVTSFDIAKAQIDGSIAMEQVKTAGLININDATNAAQATRDRLNAQVQTRQIDQQAATQRATAQGAATPGIINAIVNGIFVIAGLFGF